jgi:hypothetical protein
VIIGGELAPAGQPLLNSVQASLERWISPASGRYPVALGELGGKAEVLGAIVDVELERALADPDPLRGIAQLIARWGAAFVLDSAGVTRTKALGSETMARKLRHALSGGEGALRAAVWEFMRPMLSPRLVSLNLDAFVAERDFVTTVDLDAGRAASDLDDLDLGVESDPGADYAPTRPEPSRPSFVRRVGGLSSARMGCGCVASPLFAQGSIQHIR